MLSHRCGSEVNTFIRTNTKADEQQMLECFVRSASASHRVCRRELERYDSGKGSWENVKGCAYKEFGLAVRNLVETSRCVGECRPIV